jgi:hypothetical protein
MIDATAPHTRIDNVIIDEILPKIGVYGLTIYTVIKRHLNFTTGQCNPSYNRIAKMIGIDRTTVIRYVKKLRGLGLLEAELCFKEDGSPTSNQYELAPTQKSSTKQKRTNARKESSRKQSPLVVDDNPPGGAAPPEQVFSIKSNITIKDSEDTEKSIPLNQGAEKPLASEKTAPTDEKTEKQKNCPHPYADVVRLHDGITICNHCYDTIEFPLVA